MAWCNVSKTRDNFISTVVIKPIKRWKEARQGKSNCLTRLNLIYFWKKSCGVGIAKLRCLSNVRKGYVPVKPWHSPTNLHGVTTQKIALTSSIRWETQMSYQCNFDPFLHSQIVLDRLPFCFILFVTLVVSTSRLSSWRKNKAGGRDQVASTPIRGLRDSRCSGGAQEASTTYRILQ
jgi:hypothetical protein